MEAPQKKKIKLPYNRAITLQGIYPKDSLVNIPQRHLYNGVY